MSGSALKVLSGGWSGGGGRSGVGGLLQYNILGACKISMQVKRMRIKGKSFFTANHFNVKTTVLPPNFDKCI